MGTRLEELVLKVIEKFSPRAFRAIDAFAKSAAKTMIAAAEKELARKPETVSRKSKRVLQ